MPSSTSVTIAAATATPASAINHAYWRSDSSQAESQATRSSEISQLARSSMATACVAMPAASSVISAVVVANSAFGGIRISPE